MNKSLSERFAHLNQERIPQHVAIIMDGNGRWAKRQGKPRLEGHRQGVQNVRAIVDAAGEAGIRYLTLYAFSAENWNRPEDEVRGLMQLLDVFLGRYTRDMIKNRIRLHTIGDISKLPPRALGSLQKAMKQTESFNERHLILALNYGARQEMVHAVKAYAHAVKEGLCDPSELDWSGLAGFLYTSDIPDPDLVIRTSGEMRLSNYLLMQSAYSEFYFTPVCWPEFTPEVFLSALEDYQSRERRFGLTGEQLEKSIPLGSS